MHPKKLFLALPCYGGMPARTVRSLIDLVRVKAFPIQINSRDGDSLVTRARNSLTADFLASDCEKLLFIDTDLIFTPADVERIVSHDLDVVAGFYPIKEDAPGVRWCANGPPGQEQAEPGPNGLAAVRYIGTGFMCIKRIVFERMIEAGNPPHPLTGSPTHPLSYVTDTQPKRTEHDFWQVGVYQYPDGARRYLSEDWMFCQRWLDLGGEVWGDTQVVLQHVGTAVYPLSHQRAQCLAPSSDQSDQSARSDQSDSAAAPTHSLTDSLIH